MKLVISTTVALTIISCAAAALLGGLRDVNENDEGVRTAANKALDSMRASINSDVGFNGVISAQYKIIAGIQYHLKLAININNARKECSFIVTFRADLQSWSVKGGDPSDVCFSMLSDKPRVSHIKKRSAGLLGGVEDLDMNDQYVQGAADWAVEEINRRSNSMNRLGLQKIADGSRQVVNGYKYKFLLYLVSTNCRNNPKNSRKTLKDCPAEENPLRQQCDVAVLISGGNYTMLKMDCKPVRPILGGDGHDNQPHGKVNLIGGDTHDYVPHGSPQNLLGGDGHDYKPHGKKVNLIGGDSHDYVPHGSPKNLLGGDGHDYKPHGKKLLGRGDHDYLPHYNFKKLLGGDGHDYLLGKDLHDYIPHINRIRGLINKLGSDSQKEKILKVGEEVLQRTGDILKGSGMLGGDGHDYQPHGVDICQEHRAAFEEFKLKHKRLYATSKVEAERFQIFCGNMEKVKEYQKMEKGSAVYGASKFADMSETEFKRSYLGWKQSSDAVPSWPSAEIPKGSIPESFDWRQHNVVTPVKNQGSCGSCWAFSTTGNIEGLNAIKHKELVSLSEQELLDCDKVDEACNGGLPSQAYDAIMKLGGIESEKDYSYDAEKESCKFTKSKIAAKVVGAVNISQNEEEIAAWLAKNGPISIGINAFAMQFYMGGVAHPWKIFCNPRSLDHGVLIVGYGKEGNEPYWIVKNSWGPDWGRQGYYYVYRGDGTCGLNTMCTSAVVE